MTSNFNNISSNTNLINTNFNNISSNTNLINNLNSTVSTNFNNISSNFQLISQLQTGSFDSNLYYNNITTNNLLSEKLDTSVLNNTLIQNITTTATFKIAEFGNYNNFFEMYNNYFDSYVYGSLTGSTMFLNQRGFGDVEINNSSTFQNDKIILNHNTTIISNLQVSGSFSCSSILDITGSDARYVLQSDGLSGLITGNTNTINSIITSNNSQDISLGQKLDKIDTNAQSIAGAINFSDNATLHSDLNMLTTGSIICNKFSTTPSPNLGLQMTFQMFNREFNINRDGRMWMSSAGGQWETQIGDANVGRVWVKDRFGLGAVGVNGYVLHCAGKSRFISFEPKNRPKISKHHVEKGSGTPRTRPKESKAKQKAPANTQVPEKSECLARNFSRRWHGGSDASRIYAATQVHTRVKLPKQAMLHTVLLMGADPWPPSPSQRRRLSAVRQPRSRRRAGARAQSKRPQGQTSRREGKRGNDGAKSGCTRQKKLYTCQVDPRVHTGCGQVLMTVFETSIYDYWQDQPGKVCSLWV